MDWKEMADLIKTRRSIRAFQNKAVPEDVLLKALELATWAPNGGNHQAWRFLIVSNKELIGKMADAVKAKTELMLSWPEAAQFSEVAERWRKNVDFFRAAPVCVAVLMGKYVSVADQILRARGEKDPVAEEVRSWRRLASTSLQGVGGAIAYFLLIVHHLGLAATWMGGPQQAKREIEQLLGVPAEWDFVALIPVGYPAEPPRTSTRKPIAEVVEFRR